MTNEDYDQGQMMGMLTIIRLMRSCDNAGTRIPEDMIDSIERTATESLSGYLQKPAEDVIMLLDKELGTML